jgi:O-antigen/teichoic acid export membrane protein
MIQAALAVIRYGGSIGAALAGAGPLAFVLPLPVMALADWVLTSRCNPERPWRRPPRPGMWPGILSRTSWVMVGTFASGVVNMGNYLVVGLFVPDAVVGVYFFALQIVMQIGTLVTANVNQVLLPALARMEGERQRQSRAAARAIRQLMLLAAPLGMGLIPTFGALERLIWGGDWASASASVAIIAAFYPATVIHAVPFAALQAWGLFRTWAVLLLLQGAAMMGAGALGAVVWGTPEAISLASSATMLVSTVLFAIAGLRPCGLSAPRVLSASVPAWTLALAAAGAGWWLVQGPLRSAHPGVRFVAGGAAFCAVYGVLTRLLLARHVREAMLVVPTRWRPLANRSLLFPDE